MTARERTVLDRLKESYEANGYQFFIEPTSQLLPKMVAEMHPDAIALRGDEKVIIELKSGEDAAFAGKIANISNLLISRGSDWKLVVFPIEDAGSLGSETAETSREGIEKIVKEAESLHGKGHYSAALLLGWGGLEASARAIALRNGDLPRLALGPGKSVDYLEQMGEVLGPDARKLRRLLPIRNALVHGLYSEIPPVGAEESASLLRVLDELVDRPPLPSTQ